MTRITIAMVMVEIIQITNNTAKKPISYRSLEQLAWTRHRTKLILKNFVLRILTIVSPICLLFCCCKDFSLKKLNRNRSVFVILISSYIYWWINDNYLQKFQVGYAFWYASVLVIFISPCRLWSKRCYDGSSPDNLHQQFDNCNSNK